MPYLIQAMFLTAFAKDVWVDGWIDGSLNVSQNPRTERNIGSDISSAAIDDLKIVADMIVH